MTDDWREDGEWGSVLEIHQILDGAGIADSAAVEDRVRLMVERTEKAEAAAKDFAQALTVISECKPGSSQTDIPGLIARNALARHTEYALDASDRKEKETG